MNNKNFAFINVSQIVEIAVENIENIYNIQSVIIYLLIKMCIVKNLHIFA